MDSITRFRGSVAPAIGRHRVPRWVLVALAGALATLMSCHRAPSAARGGDATGPRAAASAKAAAGPAANSTARRPISPVTKRQIARVLSELRVTVQCNRLMGCKPLAELRRYGKAAVPEMISELEAAGKSDAYWVSRFEGLLGKLGDPRARGVLEHFLRGDRWEMRADAALALGALGGDPSLLALEDALGRARRRHQLPTQAAILAAIATLGAKVDGVPGRDALIELLNGLGRARLEALNPGYMMFLARLVGSAHVSEALPLARLAARSDNLFVAEAALGTLGALEDTGGIAYAIERMHDPVPSVRRAAIRCLQEITGNPHRSAAAEWKAWCTERRCLTRYRGATPR